MKLVTFLLTFFAITTANAHFKIGFYDGTATDGSKCSFEIKAVNFKNNLKHPLNEQVEIEVASDRTLTFTHLAIVDAVKGTVRPKAKTLSAVEALENGAVAMELIMNHEGPVQMLTFTDNYSDASLNERNVCANLKYRE